VFDVLRATVSANPATIAVGQSTNFTASVSGGAGGPTYLWASLPPGCTSSNGPMDECAPTAAGTYNVTVSIRDSRNDPATASVELTVGPASSTSQPTGLGTSSLGTSLTLELIGIAAAAGILGAIAVLFLLRRRGSPGPQLSPPPAPAEPVAEPWAEAQPPPSAEPSAEGEPAEFDPNQGGTG
ncbi:MAG: PKD domain-containing protein, partial [Thermoplasmata archaeon]|nr:PKD domain-containing protein [Thermoplasmata archaeon]